MDNAPYISPTPGKIPIVAEGTFPAIFYEGLGEEELGEENERVKAIQSIVSQLIKCHFNLFYLFGNNNKKKIIFKTIDSQDYQIDVLIQSEYLSATPYSAVKSIQFCNKYPRIKGLNLWDEPSYYMWGDALCSIQSVNQSLWNRLSVGYMMCRQLNPQRMTFWTLAVPGGSNNGKYDSPNWVVGNCECYGQYLDILQELYRPALWVYDVYPIVIKRNPQTNEETVEVHHDHFYCALRMFSSQSKKTGRPFWAYGMVLKHAWFAVPKNYKGEELNLDLDAWKQCLPLPTYGVLKFEIFSALACGAQGIVYYRFGEGFTQDDLYWFTPEQRMRHVQNDEIMLSLDAPCKAIMQKDSPDLINATATIKYNVELLEIIEAVNSEVRKYENVFLGATLEKLFQIGSNYNDGIPKSSGLSDAISITMVSPIGSETEASYPGFLLSILSNNGKEYVVLVSHDPFASQYLSISFFKGYKLVSPLKQQVNIEGFQDISFLLPGKKMPILGKDTIHQKGPYIIDPGGYVIFERI